MLKHITVVMAFAAALPTLAQEPAPYWGAAGKMPSRQGRPDMHQRMLEKFDADKDGKLSDAEKEAMKAEFRKRGPRPEGKDGKFGPRPEGKDGKRGSRRHRRGQRPEGMPQEPATLEL